MIHRAPRLRGVTLLASLLAAACAPGDPQPAAEQAGAGLPTDHPAIGAIGAPGTALTGVIKETMDGGGYTFALMDLGDQEIWVAGPETVLTLGQAISLPDTMSMGQFEAKSIERTFEVLYFTTAFGSQAPADVASLEFQGTVEEAINSAGYTYLLVAAGDTSIWLAAPETELRVGQNVAWTGGMSMVDFHSSSLDRTFAEIYFVESVRVVPPGA